VSAMTSQTTTPADVAAVEEFAFRCVGDFSGAMSVLLAALGDRLGLFRALEDGGPATPAELARRAGAHERYVHEWLRGMVAAGYLTLDRASGRFALPPAHAPALAHEAGPYFMPGAFSMIQGLMTPYEHLVEAFRRGGGVEQREYGASVWDGMQRFTASWFENLLLGQWMPHLPDVDERLRRGARLADVGCGSGRAVITLARAYPASTFVGYDVFEGQIDRARRAAAEAGVADRVRFE
jgi:hypothetical protein